jgi:hypothetical protein
MTGWRADIAHLGVGPDLVGREFQARSGGRAELRLRLTTSGLGDSHGPLRKCRTAVEYRLFA